MKKETFFRTAMIALLSASVFVACKDDNDEKSEKVSVSKNAVDLGLTSGTKWAKMNIGAKDAWDFGKSYAWGETRPKQTEDATSWNGYLHMNTGTCEAGQEWVYINKYQIDDGNDGIWYSNVKFVGDGKRILEPEDDAASVHWGGDWSTPSLDDFKELYLNCEIEYVENSFGSVLGMQFSGNGNSIFLPQSGCVWHLSQDFKIKDTGERYWTNELSNTGYAVRFWGNADENTTPETSSWQRFAGHTVRPICPANGNTNGHDAVDLGLPSGKLWGTMNVGAQNTNENGYYLAWGETEPKEIYSDSSYKYIVKNDNGYMYSKYQINDHNIGGIWYTKDFVGDGKSTLEAGDDAAVTNWGGSWQMPTNEQVKELVKECYWLWTDNYNDNTNVGGYIVYKAKVSEDKGKIIKDGEASTNYTLADAHIFFPIIGINADGTNYGGNVGYWTSSLRSTLAGYMFQTSKFYIDYGIAQNRYKTNSIRPVCK